MEENQNNTFFVDLENNISFKIESLETDKECVIFPKISKNKNSKKLINLNPIADKNDKTKKIFLSKKRKLSKFQKEKKSYSKKRNPPLIKDRRKIISKIFDKCINNIISYIENRIKNRFNQGNFKLPLQKLKQMLNDKLEKALEKDLGSFFNKKATKLGSILNEETKKVEQIHLLNEIFKMKIKEILLMYGNNYPYIDNIFNIKNTRQVLNDKERKEIKIYLDNYENNKQIKFKDNYISTNLEILINDNFSTANENTIQLKEGKENIFKIEHFSSQNNTAPINKKDQQKKQDKFRKDNLLHLLMHACLNSFNIFIKNIIKQIDGLFEINDAVIKNDYLKNNKLKQDFASKKIIKIYSESFKKNSKEKDESKSEKKIKELIDKNELLNELFNLEYKEVLYYYVNKKIHSTSKIKEEKLKGFKTFDEDEKFSEIKEKIHENIHDLAKELYNGELKKRKLRKNKNEKE